jgi:hypothetical protein
MDAEKQHEETCLCPGCGSKYRVPKEFLGRSVACKQCGNRFKLQTQNSNSAVKSTPEAVKPAESYAISCNDPLLAIGKLAVQYKFATKEQVRSAFLYQQNEIKKGSKKPLGEILVSQGAMNQNQLRYLLAIQALIDTRQLDRRFGEMVIDKGFAGSKDIEKALEKQKQLFEQAKIVKPIGDILVASKVLSREQRDAILLEQQCVPRSAEPFEPIAEKTSSLDQWLEVKISEDRLSAFLSVRGQLPTLDLSVIKEYLTAKGIVQGLAADQEIMDYFLDQAKRDKPLLAARGVGPEKGLNVQLFLHFQHKGAKPESIPDLVCMEQTGIKSVKKDDLLAEKRSAEPGQEGIDVFGRPLPPLTGQDFPLQAGRGTRLAEDGRKVYAETEGLPQLSISGKVMVVPHLFIPGDVGVETGNIDFNGRVEVHGTIQNGYQVKCESLTAKETFKSRIEATGDVDIVDGINGAIIRTRGNVRAKFIHRAVIEAFGDVTAEREIIDSKIEIGGSCKIKNGIVVSSNITAMQGILANQIGTKTGNASTLFVGVDTRFRNEIAKFKNAADLKHKEQEKFTLKLNELQAKDLQITQKIGMLAQQQDLAMINKRKLHDKLEEIAALNDLEAVGQLKAAIKELETEIRDRDKALESLFNEQDQINRELPGLQKTMAELDAAIKALEAEIKIVEGWLAKKTPLAEIKVFGTIYAETMLKGNKAGLLLPETFDRVQIKEIKALGADKKMDLRFRITRLE